MLLYVYFSVQIVKMNPQSACDVPTFTVLLQKKASTGLYSVFIQFSNTSTTKAFNILLNKSPYQT